MAIKAWALAMVESKSGPVKPVFYYNHISDTWVRDYQVGCTFFSKKDCDDKYRELDIFGLEVISGSVE